MQLNLRTEQTSILTAFYEPLVRPNSIIVNGSPHTGKTTTVLNFLRAKNEGFSYVKCSECLTSRILLQRSLKQILLNTYTGEAQEAICENLDAFCAILRPKLQSIRHTLVLDDIDKLPDYRSSLDLMQGFCNLTQIFNGPKNLTVLLITSTADPRSLTTQLCTPRISFPRFTNDEIKQALLSCLHGKPIEFRSDFLDILIQTLSPTNLDLAFIKNTALRIWPEFIADTDEDSCARIYTKRQHLFKLDSLVTTISQGAVSMPFPPSAALMLCAAYLASYNPPRYDMRCFSLMKNIRSKRRETHPKKQSVIPQRSLAPPPFDLERLLAIFHAISESPFEFYSRVDTFECLATLQSYNLVTTSSNDLLDSRTKWRVNASWSFVQNLAHEIEFPISEFLAE